MNDRSVAFFSLTSRISSPTEWRRNKFETTIMMKSTYFFASGLITLALVSCENPADKTANATTTDAVEASSTAASGTQYLISSESNIGFVGSKVTGSHEGGFKTVSGEFTVDENGEVNAGKVVIDMNSTWSDAEKLTGHLKSADFFDVEAHPESNFTITNVVKADSGYTVSGNLMLHGVEKNITFPATAEMDGDMVKVKAEFDINRKDWGIIYAGKTDDLIRDEVVIKFDLVASPQS
jgi:polyisoprenoid-binding protein YceI